eukprot:403366332
MWSKGKKLVDHRPIFSQRNDTAANQACDPFKNRSMVSASMSPSKLEHLNKQNDLKLANIRKLKNLGIEDNPALTSQNKKTMLQYHKKMLSQIVTKSNKRLNFNQIDNDNQNVMRYDLVDNNQGSRSGIDSRRKSQIRFNFTQNQDEADLDKWKDYKNKSLLEILNGTKKHTREGNQIQTAKDAGQLSQQQFSQNLGSPTYTQINIQTSQIQEHSNNGQELKQNKRIFKTNVHSQRASPRLSSNSVYQDKESTSNPGLQQVERDFVIMRKSIEKLQKQQLDPSARKHMRELEDEIYKNYEHAYISELGDEYAQQEKQLSIMITEVKRKTEMMRKKKMNQQFKSRGYPESEQQSQLRPLSQSNYEKTSKLDQLQVKEYLEKQFHPVDLSSKIQKRASEKLSQEKQKSVKINLLEEYKNHLNVVSKFKCFSSLKLYLDHTFYQLFMPEELMKNQDTSNLTDSFMNEAIENKFSKSVIIPSLHSYLETAQETSIPKEEFYVNSTQQLASVFYETKNFLNQMIKRKEIQNQKQEDIDVSLEKLREFFLEAFNMFKMLMVSVKHKDDIQDSIPAFALDNLFKIVMMKIDDIIQNNRRVIDKAIEMQQFQVKQLKQEAENEMESMFQQITLLKKQHQEKLESLKDKLDLAYKDTQRYKEMYHEVESELSNLTNFDKRNERMEDLKDSYTQINQLIMEAEDEKIIQIAALDQYTKMIDIGMRKRQKFDYCIQTEISLNPLLSPEFNKNPSNLQLQNQSLVNILCMYEEHQKQQAKPLSLDKIAAICESIFDATANNSDAQELDFQSIIAKQFIEERGQKLQITQYTYEFLKVIIIISIHSKYRDQNSAVSKGYAIQYIFKSY